MSVAAVDRGGEKHRRDKQLLWWCNQRGKQQDGDSAQPVFTALR